MKPQDVVAITAGTVTGATTAESIEQIIASAAAAVAVYLVKALFDYLRSRFGAGKK